MKSLRFLLPLLAALLVSVGFFLPWMGAAWQDRALGHTTVQYETAPLHLADLIDHLKLAANGYSVVALTQASTRLSAQQAEEAAQTDGAGISLSEMAAAQDVQQQEQQNE